MRMLIALLLAVFCTGAQAQMRHDPLTSREADQLRDSAKEPKRRIDLLIGFAAERVMAMERLRAPSSDISRDTTKDGLDDSGKLAEMLGELGDLIDELDDNLEMYGKHGEDLRLPLRHVLEAEGEFLQKLKALEDHATPSEKRGMAAALEDASESLQDSMEGAKALLAGQIEKRGEEKDKKKLNRQEANEGREQPEH